MRVISLSHSASYYPYSQWPHVSLKPKFNDCYCYSLYLYLPISKVIQAYLYIKNKVESKILHGEVTEKDKNKKKPLSQLTRSQNILVFNRAVIESLQWWQWKSQVEFYLFEADNENWPFIPGDLLSKISKIPQDKVSS